MRGASGGLMMAVGGGAGGVEGVVIGGGNILFAFSPLGYHGLFTNKSRFRRCSCARSIGVSFLVSG